MTKKLQQKLIMMALLFGGVLFVYYHFLFTPLVQKYKDSYVKLEESQRKLTEMRLRALELPRLRVEMKELEQEVVELERRLPKDREIPDLLRTLTKIAQHYQLKVTNISPGAILTQANYNEVPFQITLQGTYHSLGGFLTELGQESRIFSERNMNLNAAVVTKENPSTVNATFTLIAYTFKGK
jgi:type IV pilus assembly protein PilO